MKVSVLVTTYNHEKFIAQAIDSVLMQVTNFDYEVVIIEDCSTDRTREIVIDIQKRYPSKIRLVLAEKNQNDNRAWGKEILAAPGQYIALLDGDDYWTSPYKLESQVDFLDNHKECSICFHQAYNLYPDGTKSLYSSNFDYEFNRSCFTLEDIMFQNFLPTSSVVFRRGLFNEFPESFPDMPSGDWFLHVLNAQHGKIAYINQVWGVRRVHSGGIISMKSPVEKLKFNITCIEIINAYLDYKYTKQANDRIISYHYKIVQLLVREKDFKNARVHATNCLIISLSDKHISRLFFLLLILSKDSFYMLYRLLQQFKCIHRRLKRSFVYLGRR